MAGSTYLNSYLNKYYIFRYLSSAFNDLLEGKRIWDVEGDYNIFWREIYSSPRLLYSSAFALRIVGLPDMCLQGLWIEWLNIGTIKMLIAQLSFNRFY